MNIAFVQCPAWITTSPPYALSLLASVLKNDAYNIRCFDINIKIFNASNKNQKGKIHQVSWTNYRIETDFETPAFIDFLFDEYEHIIKEIVQEIILFTPDILCFSVQRTSALFSFRFSEIIKTTLPNCKIIWGGPYCFISYNNINEILRNKNGIDVVCSGDGELGLPVLMKYYAEHKAFTPIEGFYFREGHAYLQNIAMVSPASIISGIAFSDMSFFDLSDYSFESFPVIASRGCVNRCSFCNEWTCWKKYEFRPPEEIVAEIKYHVKHTPQIKTFWLSCSNLNGNIKKLEQFCDVMIRENLSVRWDSQMAIRDALSPELLRKMKAAGCNYLHFGLESASNKVLKLMNKGYNRKTASRVLNHVSKAEIQFNFNIIVGFPGETTFNFIETLFFIKRFLRHGVASSVAMCNVPIHSSLYEHPYRYSIEKHQAVDWRTTNNWNNIAIRKKRAHFAQSLYHSKFLNLFFLSTRFHQICRFIGNNSMKLLADFVSKLLHVLSYPIFLTWLAYVVIYLYITSLTGILQVKKHNRVGASNHNINRNIEAFLVRLKNETQKPESVYYNERVELLNKFTNIIAQTKDNPNFAAIIDYINTQPIDSILSELHSQSEETHINTINQYNP